MLRGSKNQRIRSLGLDQLSTYSLLNTESKDNIQRYLDRLTELGYLFTEPEHRTLRITRQSDEVLRRGKTVELTKKVLPQPTEPPAEPSPQAPDKALFQALKAVRSKLAQTEQVPAYITLQDMARKKPQTMAQLLQVSGVGEVKAARYGEIFLNAINRE